MALYILLLTAYRFLIHLSIIACWQNLLQIWIEEAKIKINYIILGTIFTLKSTGSTKESTIGSTKGKHYRFPLSISPCRHDQ